MIKVYFCLILKTKSNISWKIGSNNSKWTKERISRRVSPSFMIPHFEFSFMQLRAQIAKSMH